MENNWTIDIIIALILGMYLFTIYWLNRYGVGYHQNTLNINTNTQPRRWFILYPHRLIRHAGIIPQSFQPYYWTYKVMFAILMTLLANEIYNADYLKLVISFMIGFFGLDLWLLFRRNRRRRMISCSLSYFIDLILAFLYSGLSLSKSLERSATNGLPKNHPLVDEISLLVKELEAGRDRQSAFTVLADRTGEEDLSKLSMILEVGLEVGSPMREILESQSEILRAKRYQEGLSVANRKSVQALFPMILISFPMFITLVFFPAGVQLYNAFLVFSGIY